MKRIVLTKNNKDIMGSDGLLYTDGRLKFSNIICEVLKRNQRYKNFKHLICDGFYFAGDHLKQISQIYKL